MAKTIKEFCEQATKAYSRGPYPYSEANFEDGFLTGANVVIKEIMDCFPNSPFITPKTTLEAIVNRIKELKL